MDVAALIPVKAFGSAKRRLVGWLTDDERVMLARSMTATVITAARPYATFVVCDDDGVADFATELGAGVIRCPDQGLNEAVDHGISEVRDAGFDHVVISHGDLPLATELSPVVHPETVVIVPDRRSDGTNVLARPCSIDLPAAYGPGSFRSHVRAVLDIGTPLTVRHDRRLAHDIDTVADCCHPLTAPVITRLLGRPLS